LWAEKFRSNELNARGIDFLGRDDQRDQEKISKPDRSGTVFISPVDLMRKSYWDKPAYREAAPITRLGNVFVFSGTFHVPGQAAEALYWTGFEKVYTDKPDPAAAEESFRQSLELDPSAYFVHIELANLLLKRGAINEALQSYTNALNYAPNDKVNRRPIEEQIERITRDPHAKIPPLRNPHME
jgi:tetratricopeptide (TPR) repeat protein